MKICFIVESHDLLLKLNTGITRFVSKPPQGEVNIDICIPLRPGAETDFLEIRQAFSKSGINLFLFEDNKHDLWYESWEYRASYNVFKWLFTCEYEFIFFEEYGGAGFHSIRAKRMGLAFSGASLIVIATGPRVWRNEISFSWENDPIPGLRNDYCEQYCCRFCDTLISPSRYLLDWMLNKNWILPKDTRVIPDYIPENLEPCSCPVSSIVNPRVSICVPHFNHGEYLPEVLDSLSQNSYANKEIIVVDDGSTDPYSLEMLNFVREKHPDIRFYLRENAGPSAARNFAASVSQGEYLIFADSDNIFYADMIETFVKAIVNSGADCVTCHQALEINDESPREGLTVHAFLGGCAELGLFFDCFGDTNSIVRKSVFLDSGGFDETMRGWEDWAFFAKLCLSGYDLDVVPKALYYYRTNTCGINHTANANKMNGHLKISELYKSAPTKVLHKLIDEFILPVYHACNGDVLAFAHREAIEERRRAHEEALAETAAAHAEALAEIKNARKIAKDIIADAKAKARRI